jgi:hypothetical protein
VKGREFVDYAIKAGAGQTLAVVLKAEHKQGYFNVLPPGSDAAMFIGSVAGASFKAMVPTDGDYTVRVYLMRAAARRDESAPFTLTASLSGTALEPLPASVDALVPGTPFHAQSRISCSQAVGPSPGECDAFVIRRGQDGTATVEVRWPDGTKRRVLFVKGAVVASDAKDKVASSRRGGATVVTVGPDERLEIPDAFVTGG